jgi:cation-transporting P-type ATPase I
MPQPFDIRPEQGRWVTQPRPGIDHAVVDDVTTGHRRPQSTVIKDIPIPALEIQIVDPLGGTVRRNMTRTSAPEATSSFTDRQPVRLPRLPDLVAVPPTPADHLPRLRREMEGRLGPEGTDVLFGFVNAATAALTLSPAATAAEAATRTMLAAEACNGRLTWRRHEPGLGSQPVPDDAASTPRSIPSSPDGPAERYANRIGLAGIGAGTVAGLLSRNLDTAGAAALAAVPKPLRTVREAFGCTMSRRLTVHHDALVLRPRSLRTLDRVDAIMIDPRTLYTDEVMVSGHLGVRNSLRTHAWEAVQAALDKDG